MDGAVAGAGAVDVVVVGVNKPSPRLLLPPQ
jgi:hypothetical protein